MLPLLFDHIGTSGPMPFDDFMELCLYDTDEGFFSAGGVRPGTQGDFVTAPEVSPLFGELLARWVNRVRDESWATIEIGAGSGALLAPLLEAMPDTSAFVVERSSSARETIGKLLPSVAIADSIVDVVAPGAVVILNEVLDNVPTALVRRTDRGWSEIAVDVDSGALSLVEVPPRDAAVEWASQHLKDTPVGAMAPVQIAAGALVESILDTFDEVAICVIDYGGSGTELAGRPDDDVVRTYRHQRSGFDYLAHPGLTDITVDVNTDAIAVLAERFGAKVEVTTQRDFLRSAGADEMLSELRSSEIAMARSGDVMGQLKARSRTVELRALLDPSGFGAFKVITIVRKRDTTP